MLAQVRLECLEAALFCPLDTVCSFKILKTKNHTR